jgi:hypothetical protein
MPVCWSGRLVGSGADSRNAVPVLESTPLTPSRVARSSVQERDTSDGFMCNQSVRGEDLAAVRLSLKPL